MSKISVIVPVYNDYDLLYKHLIPSLEKQTIGLKNLEVIVVDDGSSPSMMPTKELPRWIKWLKEGHKGGNYARNVGMNIATSEYLIYPDADCELFSDCLKTMHHYLEINRNVAFAYCHFLQVDPSGWISIFKSLRFSKEVLHQYNYISVVTMIRKEVIMDSMPSQWTSDGPWNEKLNRFQDWELWLRLVRKGYVPTLIDEPLYFHFLQRKAISQTYKTYEEAKKEMFEILDGGLYKPVDVSGPCGSVKVVAQGEDADKYVDKLIEVESEEQPPSTGSGECKETFKG